MSIWLFYPLTISKFTVLENVLCHHIFHFNLYFRFLISRNHWGWLSFTMMPRKTKKPHKQQWNKHSQQNQLKQLQTGSEQLLIIFLKYPRGMRVLSFRSHCKRFHEFAALTLNAVFPSSVLAWCTWKARQSLAQVRSGPEFLCNRDVMYDGNFPVRAL